MSVENPFEPTSARPAREGAAEAKAGVSNPFVLAGSGGTLPDFTTPAAEDLAAVEVVDADDYATPADPDPAPDDDPDPEPDGGGDGGGGGEQPPEDDATTPPPPPPAPVAEDDDDYGADVYPPPEFDHAPPPPDPADDRTGSGFTGDFQSWALIGETSHRAPLSTPAEEEAPPDDGAAADADDWDIPDYDDPAVMAAFHDRTGGTGYGYGGLQRRRVGGGDGQGRRILLGGLAAAAAVAVVGGVIIFNIQQATDGPAVPGESAAAAPGTGAVSVSEAAEASTLPPSWDHAVPGCTRTRNGSVVIGADPGSTNTAQDAIMGFEWGYYVERSAAHARAYVAPNATVATEAAMQRDGIDLVPAGAKYCVYITAADTDGTTWDVELQEQWPGEPVMSWPQRITTTVTADGKHLITSIAAR